MGSLRAENNQIAFNFASTNERVLGKPGVNYRVNDCRQDLQGDRVGWGWC